MSSEDLAIAATSLAIVLILFLVFYRDKPTPNCLLREYIMPIEDEIEWLQAQGLSYEDAKEVAEINRPGSEEVLP